MAVPTVLTAIGLAAVFTLAAPAQAQEFSGGGPVDITLESDAQGPLGPGDRVEYTVRVHNTSDQPLEEAQVVQYLPESLSHLSGSGNVGTDGPRVPWDRPLEPGQRAILVASAEVTDVPEDGPHAAATVCVRPEDGAPATSCTALDHRIQNPVPWTVVAAGVLSLLAAAVGVVGVRRYRDSRGPRPEPPTPSNHTPGSVPNVRTFPGAARVYHLDVHR